MLVKDIRTAKNRVQTVLLLDDQGVCLSINEAILKRTQANLRIQCFSNPLEALDFANRVHVDLIVTDYMMYGMNGLEFISALRRTKFGYFIPIIVVTVLHDVKVHAELLKAGVLHVLLKPVDTDKLTALSNTILNQAKKSFSNQYEQ